MIHPDKALIETISISSTNLLNDCAEAVFDTTLESGILKEIPIFGSLAKLAELGHSVQDYLFTKKLIAFLEPIKKIDTKTRAEFIEKHLSNSEMITDVGEKLLDTINKVDTSKKAKYIGKAFYLYIIQEISSFQLYEIIYSIENFKIHYLDLLIEICLSIDSSKKQNIEAISHFTHCGFLTVDNNKIIRVNVIEKDKRLYATDNLSQVGILFIERIIDLDEEELRTRFINQIIAINPTEVTDVNFYDRLRLSRCLSLNNFLNELNSLTLNELLHFSVSGDHASCTPLKDFHWIEKDRSKDEYKVYTFL